MEKPPFPFSEFLEHVEALHNSGMLRGGEWGTNVIRVYEYLKPLCANDQETTYKAGQIMLVMGYVADHVHDLDQSDYAVYGSDRVGALVGQHVLRAVYEIFSGDLSKLGKGPSVEEVMRLADQYRDTEV